MKIDEKERLETVDGRSHWSFMMLDSCLALKMVTATTEQKELEEKIIYHLPPYRFPNRIFSFFCCQQALISLYDLLKKRTPQI